MNPSKFKYSNNSHTVHSNLWSVVRYKNIESLSYNFAKACITPMGGTSFPIRMELVKILIFSNISEFN